MKLKFAAIGTLLFSQIYASESFFVDNFEFDENSAVKLEESVITTTGFETSVRNTTSNIAVINSTEIQEKGYKSVEEILQSQPTINLTKDAFGSRVDLRGQGGNKARSNVKILVDGVSIVPLNKSHSSLPLDMINVDNIEAIEVIPGGGAVLYGSGTSGGVINIITKTGAAMNPVNKVNFEIGSYNRGKTSLSTGALINPNTLIQTNIVYEKSDSYLDEKDSKVVSADILTKYKISNDSDISFKYEKYNNKSHDPGALLTAEEYEEDRTQVGSNADENQFTKTNKDLINTTYNKKINDSLKFSIQGTYQLKKDEFDSDNGNRLKEFTNNNVREEQIDFKPKLQLKYGNDNVLVVGYDYNYVTSSRDVFSLTPKKTQNSKDNRSVESHSIYALNTYKINKLELTQGIRYNHTENNYETKDNISSSNSTPKTTGKMDNFAYELAANYLYSDTGNIYSKWERGFNTPNPTSLFNNPDDTQIANGYTYGLSDVKEETYNSFEVGVRDFVLGSYISLSTFYSKTDNEIYRDGTSKNWVSYNVDETERKGVELYLEQYFGKLTLSESYSYIDAEITKGKYEGSKVPDVSQNSFTLGVKYEFTSNFNAIATTIYKDAVYIDNENDGGKINEHVVTNLVFNYNIKENIRVYAGINNLFNEIYASQYRTNMYRAANERNYFAGLNYTF
ncbi:TonB-dependent receptor [uncultured Cetobacterium sp.]|uniref:TonB-dependent receptor family protein n=1 Tax=uncultured Cetobacterium sp. TaxID=527638 RepID=UPI0025E70C55|nr:TonB-dependent receptor [uncultured Cetobacterium sp.]